MFFARALRSVPLRSLPPRPQWSPRLCTPRYRPLQFLPLRPFHATPNRSIPLIPLPAAILTVLKTGKLVSFISLSSKTSLTLLPHTYRHDRGKFVAKLLAGIPLIGVTVLLLVGLDQAPNTDRLRLIYLSETEAEEYSDLGVQYLLGSQLGLIAPREDYVYQWIEEIVDNLATVAVDDVREPVRKYDPSDPAKRDFTVFYVRDGTTENAICVGSNVIVYDQMLKVLEASTDRLAVILSHEIAHSLQRHFVEQNGFQSLLLMLTDITRAALWMFTEPFGPYVNQKIDEAIKLLIEGGKERSYNRALEQEADLVGLKLLAKAGYNPEAAIEVWEMMARHQNEALEYAEEMAERPKRQNLEIAAAEYMENLIDNWFGSTHPPHTERIEYMREHMDEALQIYEETLRLNGPAKCSFIIGYGDSATLTNDDDDTTTVVELELNEKNGWYKSVRDWIWPPGRVPQENMPQEV
ncbi:peptidase family M48-domain-containing protein [Fennellomyces sp. T-0311]|nr:peptidase family M48-domain-containing protein [Fennellomyces sp. T-0311]